MNNNVPEDYETPSWPSLALPYGPFETRKILYYKSGNFLFNIKLFILII